MLFVLILFFILIKVSPLISSSHLKFKLQRYLSSKDRDFCEKVVQSKDETIKILLSSKDEAVKSRDEAVKSKDELSSRDGEHTKLLKSSLAVKSAVTYDLQGRLSLRSVIEDFESNSTKEYSEAGRGESRGERAWEVVLRSNYCGITSELGSDNSKSWIPVAKELYKRTSDDTHKYRSEKVTISRTSMTEDMATPAAAVCRSFPTEYETTTPPQTKHM